jgi:transglutaminase-like putative cysteine protease
MLAGGNPNGGCGGPNALFVAMARAVGVAARAVYGLRVAPSQWGYQWGYRSMSASGNVTRAQHCRAEFHAAGFGWVPVDPADARKVLMEEPPGNLSVADPKADLARRKLFGAWEMNWLAYNYAHDLKLPNSTGALLPCLMHPVAEVDGQRRDSLDPDGFRYAISSRRV